MLLAAFYLILIKALRTTLLKTSELSTYSTPASPSQHPLILILDIWLTLYKKNNENLVQVA